MDPLGERVARLEAVLPEIRDDLRDLKRLLTRRLDEAEVRISALERWRSYVLGIAATVGTLAGLLGRTIVDWLRGN